MAIAPIEWESLSQGERLALAAAGESSPLAFAALWFNLTQGDSFRTNWHHHYFNWAAEQMLSAKKKAICVNTPPGSTKTEFWSIHLPCYTFAIYDRVRILNASYSKSLSDENSDRARSLVKSAEFAQFYPFTVGKDKVDDWTLEQNGKRKHQLFSRSSGGQITGVRGGYMGDGYTGHVQADDWDKPDDMFSETKRQKSHQRLVNTLRSRRAHSGTPFISIQQRLHSDDTTGFLLSGGMGIEIDLHIKIPALIDQDYIGSLPDGIRERCIRDVCGSKCIDGQWSYWPAKESIDDLNSLKKASPYTFASQSMQNPSDLTGGIFSGNDFLFYGDLDDGADVPDPGGYDYRFITVDTAQKTNEWNDWTVFAEWGYRGGRIYRLSYQRERMDAKKLREDFEAFVKAAWAKNGYQDGNIRSVMVEDKSSGTGLIQEVKGRLPIPVTALPRTRDKLTRAMDVQAFHCAKKVCLPYGDRHNYEMVSEVASFTHNDQHDFDDQTDVMIDALEYVFIKSATGYDIMSAV